MKMTNPLSQKCIFWIFLLFSVSSAQSQCMIYPVDLEFRETKAEYIVLGKLQAKHSYWDSDHQSIYTLNLIEVTAWLKGHNTANQIGVITVGGVVEDQAQISHPSLQLDPWNEYVLFLKGDESLLDDKAIRQRTPGLVQAFPVADAQGAITKQRGIYHDLKSEPNHTERSLFSRVKSLTGQQALTPSGAPFMAREGDTYPLSEYAELMQSSRTAPITSFAPATTNAGTINPADYITINGSGFTNTPGTVFYTNADDGGATVTSTGVASDNVSWNDGQIQNKPASRAGTGPINVNGIFTSATSLNFTYSHIAINSTFAGHAQSERQEFKLVDKNGAGGYTFAYNTAFATNAAATAAFERALDTWRCATQVNFTISPTTTGIASVSQDGQNAIFFNPALPNGVLGRANTLFQASASGACNGFNTVWFIDEIDIEFKSDPPAGCCTWNFGPGASSILEFDFESVALHELGHAHGLGHTIAPGAVMHFALVNGTDIRSLAPGDQAGGTAKMVRNLIPLCQNPPGVTGNMTLFNNLAICSPLATPWFHFSGSRTGESDVSLNWALDRERDLESFEILRSQDGVQFTSIGQISPQAKGATPYQFIDKEASSQRTWFYQLILQDINGERTESEVIEILQSNSDFQVFPTVAQTHIFIQGNSKQASPASVSILDLTGKVVKKQEINSDAGPFEERIDLAGLPNGLYIYRVGLNEEVKTGKFMILN